MIHDTQSAEISQKQDGRNIYAIMKTMCPPGYHHNIGNINILVNYKIVKCQSGSNEANIDLAICVSSNICS